MRDCSASISDSVMKADFGLARIVYGSNAFVAISELEYENIKTAKAVLSECLFIEEKFDFIVGNFFELEATLLQSSADDMILSGHDHRWFEVQRSLLNRRLMNLLTAVHAYVDHTHKHVRNIFGKDSDITRRIDAAFCREYDENLSYRAMDCLRDFVQHRGLAIHGVLWNSRRKDKGNQILFSTTPVLVPDELRSDYKFKKSVLEELQALGERVDLKLLVRQYIECLWRIHSLIRHETAEEARRCEKVLSSAMDRFKQQNPNERSFVGLAALIQHGDGQRTGEIELFEDFFALRKHLCSKNADFENLASRYVTGEIID